MQLCSPRLNRKGELKGARAGANARSCKLYSMPAERFYGEPVPLLRDDIEATRLLMTDELEKVHGKIYLPLDSLADHIEEARHDCMLTFLEEGLLPSVRDQIRSITTDQIIEMAQDFISRFRRGHPNDFDLNSPEELLYAAGAHIIPMMISYQVKAEHSDKAAQVYNLLLLASEAIAQAENELAGEEGDGWDEDL